MPGKVAKKPTETSRIGEGIYLTPDVAYILNLPYQQVYQLMKGFWQSYKFGGKGNQAINFYALIEFFIYFQLRKNKMSSQKIKTFHANLSKSLRTRYPFAHHSIRTDFKNIWAEAAENLIKADGKNQFDLLPLLNDFLHKVTYDNNNIASKYYPLDNTKNIVVDPKFQFGQPIVNGTGIKTKTIYNLHLGGESDDKISRLYNLSVDKVKDAIRFHTNAA